MDIIGHFSRLMLSYTKFSVTQTWVFVVCIHKQDKEWHTSTMLWEIRVLSTGCEISNCSLCRTRQINSPFLIQQTLNYFSLFNLYAYTLLDATTLSCCIHCRNLLMFIIMPVITVSTQHSGSSPYQFFFSASNPLPSFQRRKLPVKWACAILLTPCT